MAKIIPFPNTRRQTSEMIDEIISSRLPNKHPDIHQCLRTEMTELVGKYFPIEEFSLSLVLPDNLSDEQFSQIEQSIRETVADQSQHMSHRANRLFFDLCLSRMAICELRHQLQKD